jgi:hypothetical protein
VSFDGRAYKTEAPAKGVTFSCGPFGLDDGFRHQTFFPEWVELTQVFIAPFESAEADYRNYSPQTTMSKAKSEGLK